MKTIAIFTTSRAEFGILSPLISELKNNESFDVLLFVGGSHLIKKYGNTIDEIKGLGFNVDATFDFMSEDSDEFSIVNGLAESIKKVNDLFNQFDFDMICIVGDRYELLSIISTAIIYKKPIIHLHGGEITEGAIDEQIRHMVSKASHLHFVICEEYEDNLRRIGEEDWRINESGALAIDNILRNEVISKEELFNEIGLDENIPLALMTYHPVTLEFSISVIEQIENLFNAVDNFNLQLVITAPNTDLDSNIIYQAIRKRVKNNNSYTFIESLGIEKYHNLIRYCDFVLGNSSSGIIEVPYFKKPTVNIGDRQNGRFRHPSIIDTDYSEQSINKGIEKALSEGFKNSIREMKFKFGDGNAAHKIADVLVKTELDNKLFRKKMINK